MNINKTALLLRAQIYNNFAINELFSKESKNKQNFILVCIGALIVIIIMSSYILDIANSLVSLGAPGLIPPYVVAMSSLLILVFTLLWSNGVLFGSKDFEMLSSLPVTSKDIVRSKFLFMYLSNFILSAIFLIPAGIVWFISTTDNMLFSIMYIVGIFFVPLIPMCIALLIGLFIMILTSKLKNKNIFQLILSLLLFVGLFALNFTSVQTETGPNVVMVILAEQIYSLYPLSKLFFFEQENALIMNALFFLISILIFWFSIELAGRNYTKINALMSQQNTASNRKVQNKKYSPLKAMYIKEAKRFFSSYLYMLNTGIFVFFLFALSIAMLFISPDTLLAKFFGGVDVTPLVGTYAPFVIATMLGLSCMTASSISLEGQNIYTLKSIPLSQQTFLNAKILFNLSLTSIGYFSALIVLLLKFDLTLLQILSLIVIPAIYSIFASVQGLYINAKFPKFDWDNEAVVIKQSLSVLLATFVAMISVALPILLSMFLPLSFLAVLWLVALVLIAITGVLYTKVCRMKII
ncbi:hypothetical protein AN643_00675 [Candidatus Epulonipiscioides saccharophilum]|nr:hypothetical protein AN643_00675 [Epulopiscium sp. SCG-B10WGA-EpuloB]